MKFKKTFFMLIFIAQQTMSSNKNTSTYWLEKYYQNYRNELLANDTWETLVKETTDLSKKAAAPRYGLGKKPITKKQADQSYINLHIDIDDLEEHYQIPKIFLRLGSGKKVKSEYSTILQLHAALIKQRFFLDKIYNNLR